MSLRETAISVMAQQDMKKFIEKHVIERLCPKDAIVLGDGPRHVFIAIANFPGKLNFHRLLDDWVMNMNGSYRVAADRSELNKLRGQRFDLLWIHFRIGSRMGWKDVEYMIQQVSPITKMLIVTYDTFILKDVETDEYEMYADLSFDDFMAIVRRDCHEMKIEGVVDPRYIRKRQPLHIRDLVKRAARRLFGKE